LIILEFILGCLGAVCLYSTGKDAQQPAAGPKIYRPVVVSQKLISCADRQNNLPGKSIRQNWEPG